MSKKQVKPHRPVYPTPAGLVTSVDRAGRPNIITLGEIFNISIACPVILGIAVRKERYSHELISASGEYVVNMPTIDIAEQVWLCGRTSGRDVVKPPLIAECPVNVECKVIGIQEIGDHDLFLGEVVAQHADEDVLDEHGKVVVERLNGFAFVLGEFWTLGRKVTRR